MSNAFKQCNSYFREALKRLPEEHRNTIIVLATGTTVLIESDLACEVVNVIGDKDWPSQICNGGLKAIEKAKQKGIKVEVIPQRKTAPIIGGHYFEQLEYQKQINFHINQSDKNYEIY